MRKVYLAVENDKCNPLQPHTVIEVFTNYKKALAFCQGYRNRWVQTWILGE